MSRISELMKPRKDMMPWYVSLAFILVMGISLRWIFGAETVFEIPLKNAKATSLIACALNGRCGIVEFAEARALIGYKGMLLFSPTIVFYLVLGVNRIATSLYPLFGSLLLGFFYFRIAKEWFGPGAGLIALLFWAFNPVEIFGAKLLLEETILQSVLLGLVYGLILLLRKPKIISSLILISSLGFLLILNLASGLQTGLILIVYLGYRKLKGLHFSLLIVFLLSAMTFTLFVTSSPISSYLSLITRKDVLVWFPLLFVAASVLLFKGSEKAGTPILFLWLLVSFFFTLFQDSCGPLSLTCTGELFNDLGPMKLIFLVHPMILIFSAYLGKGLDPLDNKTTWMIAIGTITVILLSGEIRYGPHRLIQDLHPLKFNAQNVLIYSEIAVAGLLVMVLASPLFSGQRKNGLPQGLTFILIFLFGFASLRIFEANSKQTNFEWNATYELINEIEQQSVELPIVVRQEKNQLLIEYLEGFGLTQELSSIRIAPNDLSNVRDSYLILNNDPTAPPYSNKWWKVDQVLGNLGNNIALYRTLSVGAAAQLESRARAALENEGGEDGYVDLYSSLINQGRFCDALNLWIEHPLIFQQFRYLDASYGEICPELDYETLLSGEDQRVREMFFNGLQGGVKAAAEGELQYYIFLSSMPYYPDWRSYDISLVLMPDHIYRFTAKLKANDPVIALYLANETEEWFLPQRKYEEWTTIEVLFSTYGLTGKDLHIRFSPFMIGPYQQINFTNFEIQEMMSE